MVGAGVLVVALLGVGLAALVATSPSMAGAPGLVADELADHHAPSDGGVVPTRVGKALLATEDSRFYHDPALDPRGVVRAGIGTLTGNSNEGGATIEVQLAKLLYVKKDGIVAELREVGMAFRLDARFSKRQILAMYLNAAYFGDGAYGVTAASERYFGVPADRLSWAQASLLAGLVQAPSNYDPVDHLSLAKRRQHHVLERLVATGVLTAAQARAAYLAPLDPAVPFSG